MLSTLDKLRARFSLDEDETTSVRAIAVYVTAFALDSGATSDFHAWEGLIKEAEGTLDPETQTQLEETTFGHYVGTAAFSFLHCLTTETR